MIDGCGRKIDHLRLSLTEHCNLSCRYCVPEGTRPTREMIDSAFASELVHWLSRRHGIRHVRLTGGEPLLYPKLVDLITSLTTVDTLHEVTLTTNGQALAKQAEALRVAGLSRVNVSLDTLKPDRFAVLTRGGVLAHTLAGIEAAVDHGLTPVKINVVAQRDLNDDEFSEIADWGLSRGCVVLFLEVMPIGPLAHVIKKHLVPASEILGQLGDRFTLRAIPRSVGQPATDFAVERRGLRGVIGIIAPTTRPFCERCRRIRVTHRGRIVACVHDGRQFSLKRWWNGQTLDLEGADETLQAAIQCKPAVGSGTQSSTMLALGG